MKREGWLKIIVDNSRTDDGSHSPTSICDLSAKLMNLFSCRLSTSFEVSFLSLSLSLPYSATYGGCAITYCTLLLTCMCRSKLKNFNNLNATTKNTAGSRPGTVFMVAFVLNFYKPHLELRSSSFFLSLSLHCLRHHHRTDKVRLCERESTDVTGYTNYQFTIR